MKLSEQRQYGSSYKLTADEETWPSCMFRPGFNGQVHLPKSTICICNRGCKGEIRIIDFRKESGDHNRFYTYCQKASSTVANLAISYWSILSVWSTWTV